MHKFTHIFIYSSGGVSVVVKAKKSAAEDFETIQLDQLRSHYADWVQRMHRQFDVGATFDENSSNFIITSDEHRKEPLISRATVPIFF